jgi:hypothetical protein
VPIRHARFRARLGFARTHARRCRERHRRSSARESPRAVCRIAAAGRVRRWRRRRGRSRAIPSRSQAEKWKIAPAALRFRGALWAANTSGTSGGKSAERRRRVTYRLACRLCRSCPRRVGPRGDCGRAGARTRACLCARERVEERGQRRVRRGSVGGWRKRSPRDVPGRRGRGRAGTAPPAGHGGREVAGIICPVTGHVCRVCRTVASVGALRAWKCRGGTGRGGHGRSAEKRDWPIFPGQKGRAARSKSMNRGKQV